MITNADSISDVLSIFHDGTIRQAHLDGDKLKLQVNIAYLASATLSSPRGLGRLAQKKK